MLESAIVKEHSKDSAKEKTVTLSLHQVLPIPMVLPISLTQTIIGHSLSTIALVLLCTCTFVILGVGAAGCMYREMVTVDKLCTSNRTMRVIVAFNVIFR